MVIGCAVNDPEVDKVAAMMLPRGNGRGERNDPTGDAIRDSRIAEMRSRGPERAAKNKAAKEADEALLKRMNTGRGGIIINTGR